ncbi:MAG TPA: hypothetical protein VGR28_14745 [Candidatus Thermoplasmatota archaeon]|nr:hypothetical protein [Candidatus Thermoplasmatota archaeon]
MQLAALEAAVVAAFLLLGLALVAPAPPATQSTQPTRVALERNVQDLLVAMDTMDDADYGDRMNRAIIELLNGNTTSTQALLHRAISDQALFRLTLHNSRGGSMVLYEDRQPTGEMVGRTIDWVPPLDTAFVVPEVESVDGDAMGLGAALIPLRNGYPVNDRDIAIEVDAVTNQSVHYRANVGVRYGDAQVTMGLVKNGDVTHYESEKNSKTFTLRLNSSELLPTGTQLEIRVPNAWTAVSAKTTDANWTSVGWQQQPDFWTIGGSLNAAANMVDFEFNGTRPEGSAATGFDLVAAALNSSTVGRSDLLFKGQGTTATLAAPLTRSIHLATPKVFVHGQPAPWSIVFANAQNETTVRLLGTCISGCIKVTDITIRQPDGLPIFDPGTPGTGWSRLDASTLRWTGSVELGRDEAYEFKLNVTPAAEILSHVYTPQPRLTLPDGHFSLNLSAMVDNATHVGRIRPAFANATTEIPGYPLVVGQHWLCGQAVIDDRTHQACTTYNVSRLTALKRLSNEVAKGLARCTLTIPNPVTAPGGSIRIEADFTHLMEGIINSPDYLGTRNATVTIYYPWVPKESATSKWPVLDRATTANDSLVHNFTIPSGAPYGTYLVIAEKGLDFAGGADTDQVVRKVGWFNVGVDGLTAPTILYSLTLSAWLEDWG